MSPAWNVPVTLARAILVLPSPLRPSLLSNACNPLLAKYVNELSHSILAPFVAESASTPGVIIVTAWNSIPASLEFAVA